MKRSSPEEIADFNEQLPSVIDIEIPWAQQSAVRIALCRSRQMIAEAGVNILQVRVVANVHRGPGVEQVREQNIKVHVLRGLQRRIIRAGQQTIVLSYKP